MRRVFKYATGQPIPDGAVYCGTVTQTSIEAPRYGSVTQSEWEPCWLVWHYFLVHDSATKKVES